MTVNMRPAEEYLETFNKRIWEENVFPQYIINVYEPSLLKR